MQLIVVFLCYLGKNNTLGRILRVLLPTAIWLFWFLGVLSLNHAWKEGKIEHSSLMILSHSSLLYVAYMSLF